MKYLRMFFHSLGYGVWLTGQIIKESTVMAVDTLGTGRKIAPVVLYYPLRVTKERDIAAFIAIFFHYFSSFQGRKFHMAGESYAVSRTITCQFFGSTIACYTQ